MSELLLVDSFPLWKAVFWCFYPMTGLILVELLAFNLPDDDDDFGGGKMIPAYQTARSK